MRKTGIDALTGAPWGTHFCQFYQTAQDLLDILVPYFKAGLENNEFCLWVTGPPPAGAGPKPLCATTWRTSISISAAASWNLYRTPNGSFRRTRSPRRPSSACWVEKVQQAQSRGFDGLRLSQNLVDREKTDWQDLLTHEQAFNQVVGQHPILALCTYALDQCSTRQVLDAMRSHQFALHKSEGRWQILENDQLRRMREALVRVKQDWERTFDSLPDLIAILDTDHRIVRANRAMALRLGVTPEQCIGRKCFECVHGTSRPPESCPHTHSLQDGRPHCAEVNEFRLDGDFLVSTTPLLDEQGQIVGAVHVARDITQRKRAEERLQKSEEALRQADRQKDEFLAMLAHELRNPMAPIRNAVEILRLLGPKEPALVEAQDIVDRQLSHLVRLVDDLLDVSRITRGKVQLKREPIKVAAVIASAIESSRPLLNSRGHRLEVDLPAEPLRVHGDLTRLAQAVGNLLNNAAKYTENGGRVRLTVQQEGTEVAVRVQDTGVGIAAEMLPRLFDLFTQADQTIDRAQGGLGIGLALVRRLVEMHGGRVLAFSPGLGQGSEFVLFLPLLSDAPASKTPEPPGKTSPSGARLRILVVDDNVDAAETMAILLRLLGHEVTTVHDGYAALEAAASMEPQVVLLDIGLPGLDGYEVCRRLRRDRLKQSVIVAMTGYGQDDDRQRSQKAGFDAHLVKPVDPEELQPLLTNLTSRSVGKRKD